MRAKVITRVPAIGDASVLLKIRDRVDMFVICIGDWLMLGGRLMIMALAPVQLAGSTASKVPVCMISPIIPSGPVRVVTLFRTAVTVRRSLPLVGGNVSVMSPVGRR
jgi:hypothetical protein